MGSLLDSPFSAVIATCLVTGLALSLLARLVRAPWPASIVAPIVFMVAYYLTYNKIPPFPPSGATNKIFYVVPAAALAGLLYDLLVRRAGKAGGRLAIALATALLIALWIGLPRFSHTDPTLVLVVVVLVLGGAVVLWRLATVDQAAAMPLDGGVLLAVLPGVFAPIALFGGSSTSVGLCLGLAAGFCMAALVNLFWPRPLGMTAILGAGGGLLAIIDTITLLTRHVDFPALAAFLAVLFSGQIGARVVLPQRVGPRARAVAAGVMAAAPVLVVIAILFLRYDSPF